MKDHGILFGRLYRIDYSGSGPPWPMQVWDNSGGAWQTIGIAPCGALLYDSTAPSGGVTDFTYDPIDTNYATLLIHASLRLTASGSDHRALVQFNGDSAANYKLQDLYAYSGSPGADATLTSLTTGVLGNVADANSPVGDFGHITARILNYQSPHMNKVVYSDSVYTYDSSGDMLILHVFNQWNSTAPITSLKIFPTTGNFAEFSRVSIFGLVHGA